MQYAPRRQQAALGGILVVLAATSAFAQTGGDSAEARSAPVSALTRDGAGHIVVRASRIAQPIKVDGRLDDTAYAEVPAITELIQQEPDEGARSSEKLAIWLMFDDDNLYAACRCQLEHPERMVANDMRRDSSNLRLNDSFTIALDTFHDSRNATVFGITPVGGMWDAAIGEAGGVSLDWNTVWEAVAERFEGGWVAEIAVPFKSLRYKAGRQQTWGLQIRRVMPAKNEFAFLSPVPAAWGTQGLNNVSGFATIVGLEVPPATRNLEIKPYAISRVTTDMVGPPVRKNDVSPDAGVDVKYAVTKSLIADFTYNTDFAQVEADEAQVNLTRFNLSFPEKREFFLEGQNIFAFGTSGSGGGGGAGGGEAPTMFYSRRIGLSGSRAVPIIGGGRLTGRSGPWSVGALNIQTDADASGRDVATNFSVVRLQRNVLRRSVVGGILTRRSVSTAAPGANDVWGLDANFGFHQSVYLSGYLVRSRTEGKTGDQGSYRTQFSYNADRYGLALDRLVVEENFNPEVGFLRRENFRRNFALTRFSPRPRRNRYVRKFSYEGSFEYITDNDNHLESRELRGQFRTDLNNSDAISVQYLRLYEFVPASFAIAEGVRIPVGGYPFDTVKASFTMGQQHRVSGTATLEIGGFYDGRTKAVTYRGRVNITTRLGLEPNISLNWIELPTQSFTSSVVGTRTTFTVTPRMFVSALVQYSSSNTSVSSNLRFRWEYQPGSELFVVYTEARDTFPARKTVLENRGFVVKVNRLFRL